MSLNCIIEYSHKIQTIDNQPTVFYLAIRQLPEDLKHLIPSQDVEYPENRVSMHVSCNNQISANNSTPLCYLKKTWYSAIIRVRISSRIGGNNSTRVIFERVRTGLVIVLGLTTILGFKYRASTQLRLQTFKTRLENESRVSTPIRRNLVTMQKMVSPVPNRDVPSRP